MTYQGLEDAGPLIDTIVRAHRKDLRYSPDGGRTGPSVVYRTIRRNNKFSLIGDYAIMSYVVCRLTERGEAVDRRMITRMSSLSEEYRGLTRREKFWWLDNLSANVEDTGGEMKNLESRLNQKPKRPKTQKRTSTTSHAYVVTDKAKARTEHVYLISRAKGGDY